MYNEQKFRIVPRNEIYHNSKRKTMIFFISNFIKYSKPRPNKYLSEQVNKKLIPSIRNKNMFRFNSKITIHFLLFFKQCISKINKCRYIRMYIFK